MKGSFTKKIGSTEFTFEFDVASNADFFEQVSFYTELPTYGPDGATDLILRVREVDDNKFFEIYCPSHHQVWTLGQHKKPVGSLYPKSKRWEPAYGDPPAQVQLAVKVVEEKAPVAQTKQVQVVDKVVDTNSVAVKVPSDPQPQNIPQQPTKVVAKVPTSTIPKIVVPITPVAPINVEVDTSDLKPESFRPAGTAQSITPATNVSPEIIAQAQSVLGEFLNQTPNQ